MIKTIEDRNQKNISEISKEQYLKDLAKELHKPVRTHFLRRKVSFQFLDQVWVCDLCDMSMFSQWNKGYKWMLNCVDGFSRFAFSQPIKDKSAEYTFQAFEKIIASSGRKPNRLWCDQGKEFVNKLFAKDGYTPDDGSMYFVYNENKACIVERFNRTLKTIMWRKGTELQTKDWVKMLPGLIDDYNNTIHSTLKMTPTEATKKQNFKLVKSRVDHTIDTIPDKDTRIAKFSIGETIRISKTKRTFHKGYEIGWSQEQFKIGKIIRPNNLDEPIVYKIVDDAGEEVLGSFYSEEMQSVKNAGIYLVDKTLKKRTTKGKTEYYVSWVGFDSSANSWVDAKDFVINKI